MGWSLRRSSRGRHGPVLGGPAFATDRFKVIVEPGVPTPTSRRTTWRACSSSSWAVGRTESWSTPRLNVESEVRREFTREVIGRTVARSARIGSRRFSPGVACRLPSSTPMRRSSSSSRTPEAPSGTSRWAPSSATRGRSRSNDSAGVAAGTPVDDHRAAVPQPPRDDRDQPPDERASRPPARRDPGRVRSAPPIRPAVDAAFEDVLRRMQDAVGAQDGTCSRRRASTMRSSISLTKHPLSSIAASLRASSGTSSTAVPRDERVVAAHARRGRRGGRRRHREDAGGAAQDEGASREHRVPRRGGSLARVRRRPHAQRTAAPCGCCSTPRSS